MSRKRHVPGAAEIILGSAAEGTLLIDSGRCTLDDFLDRHAPAQYRKSAEHLLLALYRNRGYLESELRRMTARPPERKVKSLLLAAMAQSAFQEGIASESSGSIAVELAKKYRADKFVNAVLRRFYAEKQTAPTNPAVVLPPQIFKRWQKRFAPAELKKLADLFRSEADFSFRLERGIRETDFSFETLDMPGRFTFASADARAVIRSRFLAEGKIYIQDPAAALAPSLPDYSCVKKALDLCAAPGGKSLMMAELLPSGAELTAYDRSESRQKLTEENFRKRGLSHKVLSGDHLPEGVFDLVLADVPCSNTGVFRRRPDALWRFSEKELQNVVKLQQELLELAAGYTSPGGQLVYSTCSIEPEENEILTERFVASHPDFELVSRHLQLPGRQNDGASCFLLKRRF